MRRLAHLKKTCDEPSVARSKYLNTVEFLDKVAALLRRRLEAAQAKL
jgi:hypothetical protein